MGRDFLVSLYVCYRILVPALTVKVKVVAIKKCGVKSHIVIVWRKCTVKKRFVNRKFLFSVIKRVKPYFIW